MTTNNETPTAPEYQNSKPGEAWNAAYALPVGDAAEAVAWRGVVEGRTAFLCRTKDEIDRLASDYNATIEPLFAHPLPNAMREAADHIASLEAENARLARLAEHHSDLREQYLAEATASEAEREALREALAPFEELADEGNEDQLDDTKVIVHAGRSIVYTLRLSDLRRARATLRALLPRQDRLSGKGEG
ncbi:hypothetical protein NKI25_18520 [Mesorhizobium sp. M0808]|uniref:hypothetical protein n=1 Tax=Mesorhizobium sp. M0808 TaxID=2957002 RepID=UPI003338B0C2